MASACTRGLCSAECSGWCVGRAPSVHSIRQGARIQLDHKLYVSQRETRKWMFFVSRVLNWPRQGSVFYLSRFLRFRLFLTVLLLFVVGHTARYLRLFLGLLRLLLLLLLRAGVWPRVRGASWGGVVARYLLSIAHFHCLVVRLIVNQTSLFKNKNKVYITGTLWHCMHKVNADISPNFDAMWLFDTLSIIWRPLTLSFLVDMGLAWSNKQIVTWDTFIRFSAAKQAALPFVTAWKWMSGWDGSKLVSVPPCALKAETWGIY